MFDFKKMSTELKKMYALKDTYDMYRLVEPISHLVYDYQDGQLILTDGYCFDIWRMGVPCQNCISKHTCNSSSKYLKLEFLDGTVFLITSFPVKINGVALSLELVNNVTKNMFVSSFSEKDNEDISSFINKFNSLVVHDSFTGLYNKNFIADEIDNSIDNLSRDKNASVIGALMDIDQFKHVNDTYGHYMGDVVITRISAILNSFTDWPQIWAGRLGGDEFCIFFKNHTKESAERKCKTLEELIAKQIYTKGDEEFTVSVSIGVDVLTNTDTRQSFLDKLDKLLYEEKRIKKMKKSSQP